jgi:hypothetical protein
LKETYLVVTCEDAAKKKTRLQFFSHLAVTYFIGQHFIQKYLFK